MERTSQGGPGWLGTAPAKRTCAINGGVGRLRCCGFGLSRLRWVAVACSFAVATCGQKGPLEPPPSPPLADVAEHGVAMREFQPRLEAG